MHQQHYNITSFTSQDDLNFFFGNKNYSLPMWLTEYDVNNNSVGF